MKRWVKLCIYLYLNVDVFSSFSAYAMRKRPNIGLPICRVRYHPAQCAATTLVVRWIATTTNATASVNQRVPTNCVALDTQF